MGIGMNFKLLFDRAGANVIPCFDGLMSLPASRISVIAESGSPLYPPPFPDQNQEREQAEPSGCEAGAEGTAPSQRMTLLACSLDQSSLSSAGAGYPVHLNFSTPTPPSGILSMQSWHRWPESVSFCHILLNQMKFLLLV